MRGLIAIGLLALSLLLWQLADVVLLVLLAVIVAVVLTTVSLPLQRIGVTNERLAILATVVVLVLGLGLVGWLLGSEARTQASQAVNRAPAAWTKLRSELGLPQVTLEQLMNGSGLAQKIGQMLTSVLGVTSNVAGAVTNLVVVLMGGIYLALQPGLYRDGVLLLVPGEAARLRLGQTLDLCARALRYWILGQFASMALVGVLTGLGLWLIGMTAPLVLGLTAGLLQFVPLIGPIASAVPALLLAVPQGIGMILWTLAVYVVVQQVESNVITPMIQRRAVALPPALTLFAIIAGGSIFGVLGFLVATPILVIAYVATARLWIRGTLDRPVDVPGEG